jgi:hypothetical protein
LNKMGSTDRIVFKVVLIMQYMMQQEIAWLMRPFFWNNDLNINKNSDWHSPNFFLKQTIKLTLVLEKHFWI